MSWFFIARTFFFEVYKANTFALFTILEIKYRCI